LEVDDQVEFDRLLNGQIGRLRSLQDLVYIGGAAPKEIRQACAIGHQTTREHVLANLEHPGNSVIRKEVDDLLHMQFHAEHWRRALRARRERPRRGRAADKRDELAPFHSITSSAATSSLSGTVRPSALAVLRLITSSYLVGACTGRSIGFSPF